MGGLWVVRKKTTSANAKNQMDRGEEILRDLRTKKETVGRTGGTTVKVGKDSRTEGKKKLGACALVRNRKRMG